MMTFPLTTNLAICIRSQYDLQSLLRPLDDLESIMWEFKLQQFELLPIPQEIINVDRDDFNEMLRHLVNLKSIITLIPNITQQLEQARKEMITKRVVRVEKYLQTKLRGRRRKRYEDFAEQGLVLIIDRFVDRYVRNYIAANPDVSCPQLDAQLKRKLILNMVHHLGNVDYITSFTDSNIIDAEASYKNKYSTVKILRNKLPKEGHATPFERYLK